MRFIARSAIETRVSNHTLWRVAFGIGIDEYCGRNFILTQTPCFFVLFFLRRQKNTHFERIQNVRLLRDNTIRIVPDTKMSRIFFFFSRTSDEYYNITNINRIV